MTRRRVPVWVVALGLIPVCWIYSVVVYVVVASATHGDCYQAASDAALNLARGLLALNAILVLGLWISVWWRRQWWLLPVGVLASAVAVAAFADAWMSSPIAWTDTRC